MILITAMFVTVAAHANQACEGLKIMSEHIFCKVKLVMALLVANSL